MAPKGVSLSTGHVKTPAVNRGMKYTLVRHSGYPVGGNPQFEYATEEEAVGASELAAVNRAGGVIYNSYVEAHNASFNANYPPEIEGLIPRCKGTFVKVGRFDLFVPDGAAPSPVRGDG